MLTVLAEANTNTTGANANTPVGTVQGPSQNLTIEAQTGLADAAGFRDERHGRPDGGFVGDIDDMGAETFVAERLLTTGEPMHDPAVGEQLFGQGAAHQLALFAVDLIACERDCRSCSYAAALDWLERSRAALLRFE